VKKAPSESFRSGDYGLLGLNVSNLDLSSRFRLKVTISDVVDSHMTRDNLPASTTINQLRLLRGAYLIIDRSTHCMALQLAEQFCVTWKLMIGTTPSSSGEWKHMAQPAGLVY
jgi:hypothetical protein